MTYLSTVSRTPSGFIATFTSGATTTSEDTAIFFSMMQDKQVSLGDLGSRIAQWEALDGLCDWQDVRRIAATFTKAKAA